jgi:hypothetical protein
LASIGYPPGEITATSKLPSLVGLIVVITVEHDLKAPLGNTHPEVCDEWLVLV